MVATEFAVRDRDSQRRSVRDIEWVLILASLEDAYGTAFRPSNGVEWRSYQFLDNTASACPGYCTEKKTPPPLRATLLSIMSESSNRLCSVKIAPPLPPVGRRPFVSRRPEIDTR